MRFAYMPDTHFGVYDQEVPSPEEVAAGWDQVLLEAETAERVGFDGIFIPERHGRPETFTPSPILVATAIAARTERVTIATTVMMPPLHNPMELAEEIAMVDNLSKGRFVFGAGVGYHEGYHQTFGIPFRRRGKRFEEAMEVITRALTEDRFSFHGEFYDYDDVQLTPKGYQRPRPPIWIGAHTEGKPVDRALDYDGWVLWTLPAWDETEAWITDMRKRAAERGREGWTVVLDQDGWIGDDAAAVRERHSPRWLREATFYGEHDFPAEIDPKTDTSQAEGAETALRDFETRQMHFGTAESWVERIKALEQKLAPDWLNIRTRGPRAEYGPDYPSTAESIECIERFGKDVISKFR
jgi:alkanesulfonate monooxygenase SsuD/methylene tetrahydromethanopterin reductase-like flavin-dependent oxidoreductase (luciferase family)